MKPDRIVILDERRIDLKLQRMAYQIWEHNSTVKAVTLIGIENGGATMAENLGERLRKISDLDVTIHTIRMNKRDPLAHEIVFNENLDGRNVVLVDDVANSGKTLLYALRPILNYKPDKITIAVLVDRKHKTFPVKPDIIGHSIATTLQEHIVVEIEGNTVSSAYIE